MGCPLHSVVYLRLGGSRLEEEVPPHIEALPSLRLLCLDNSYVGKELCFSSGFVKVTYMALVNFSLLNKITIEEGVRPNLDFLIIDTCLSLQRLPLGIEHLTKLQGYTFESVSEQFTQSMREGGVDHGRMLHVDERCKKYAKYISFILALTFLNLMIWTALVFNRLFSFTSLLMSVMPYMAFQFRFLSHTCIYYALKFFFFVNYNIAFVFLYIL